MKQQALISALSLRAKEKNILLLEELKIDQPKTKEVAKVIKALPLAQKRTLYILKTLDPVLKRATQNLSGILGVRLAQDLNAQHVLRWPKLLIAEEALEVLKSRLLEEKQREKELVS